MMGTGTTSQASAMRCRRVSWDRLVWRSTKRTRFPPSDRGRDLPLLHGWEARAWAQGTGRAEPGGSWPCVGSGGTACPVLLGWLRSSLCRLHCGPSLRCVTLCLPVPLLIRM